MLKKRHNTLKVILFAVAVLVCAAYFLWRMSTTIYLRTETVVFTMIALSILVISRALSLTVGRNAVVVEQPMDYPPENIDPIQAGCIIDAHIGNKDIASAFYYMAQKGYFKINEYERKKFEFTYLCEPKKEQKGMVLLFNAIFENRKNQTVKLSDCADRISEVIPKVIKTSYKSITSHKNKEIADMTGKVQGFRKSLLNNKGAKAEELFEADPDYVFKVFPYAYAFSISAKLSSNFEDVMIRIPDWYKAYGVDNDYVFDVVLYNSMVRNLPEQLKKEVFK